MKIKPKFVYDRKEKIALSSMWDAIFAVLNFGIIPPLLFFIGMSVLNPQIQVGPILIMIIGMCIPQYWFFADLYYEKDCKRVGIKP